MQDGKRNDAKYAVQLSYAKTLYADVVLRFVLDLVAVALVLLVTFVVGLPLAYASVGRNPGWFLVFKQSFSFLAVLYLIATFLSAVKRHWFIAASPIRAAAFPSNTPADTTNV